MKEKFFVSTPIYYVNDKPHVGHAYTTIAADTLARYYRQMGHEVFSMVGTDEHGAKIAEAAEKNNKTPQEFCDELSSKFKEAWDKLNISYDKFYRTTDPQHERLAKKFLQELFDRDLIYKGTYKGLYCVGCESYKKESDLVDGLCPDHKKAPTELEEENYFFKLSNFNDELKQLITKDEIKVRPESRKNEVLGLLEQGLEDIAISRKTVDWGIPLPFDESQTTYVWIEALMNYVTVHGIFETEETFNKWWPADVHFVGKDIIKFHALIWPAMLLGIEKKLPKQVFAHGFFTVDGQKMSKTIGNVVDPVELSEKYGIDCIRYFVLSEFSFGQDGDLSVSRIGERYQSDLANGIGNLVSRVFAMSSKLSTFELDFSKEDHFRERTKTFWENYHSKIQSLKFNEVLEIVRAYAQECDRYVEENKPWELAKSDEKRLIQVLSNLLEAIRHLAWSIKPFMPETAEKILKALNQTEFKTEWNLLEGKIEIEKIQPLFPRIEE